tara:strand:+ start:1758 stop:2030 length:273 start_codon:yes stop_codon:yes gene_type:complete
VGPPKTVMPYHVYVLANKHKRRLVTYVGYTKDLKKRLNLHNLGRGAKFTRGRSWKIIYTEKFITKNEAISREYYIKKNRKLRNYIKKKYI